MKKIVNTRRRKITVVALALLLVGGVAWAAVMSTIGTRGTIGKGQFVAAWVQDYPSSTATTVQVYEVDQEGALGAKVGSATKMQPSDPINTTKALYRTLTVPTGQTVFYGEAMVTEGAKVMLNNGAGRAGYVSGLQAAAVPSGWKISLAQGCGAALPIDATSGTPVQLRFEPTNEVPGDLNLTNLDVRVVATAGTAPSGITCAPLGG